MVVFFIIGLIVLVAAIVLAVIFVRKVLKIILLVLLVIGILAGITGYLAYKDAMDLKENFAASPSIYLLDWNGEIAAGFETSMEEAEPVFLDAQALAAVNDNHEKKDYKEILGDNYKMFVFEKEAFEAVETVEYGGDSHSKEVIYDIFEGDGSAEDKGMAFGVLVSTAGGDKGPLFMIEQYKEGNVKIYPKTIVFDLLKVMPLSWLEKSIGVGE